jgi:hypothetical protein
LITIAQLKSKKQEFAKLLEEVIKSKNGADKLKKIEYTPQEQAHRPIRRPLIASFRRGGI